MNRKGQDTMRIWCDNDKIRDYIYVTGQNTIVTGQD